MKLYCGISYHGFGHLTQSVAVLDAFAEAGHLDALTVQTAAPKEVLNELFNLPFSYVQDSTDVGIAMINAVKTDIEATYSHYEEQYRQRSHRLEVLESHLQRHKPDIVLTNNSHLLARAAANRNIPCFHFCSLNWADIFLAYCSHKPEAQDIYNSVCADYNTASTFYRLPPYMPMPGFSNLHDVNAVSRSGQRHKLHEHFGHANNVSYVLVTMGGMPYDIPFSDWPTQDDIVIINGGKRIPLPRNNFIDMRDSGLSHLDLVASCDVVITKPGYGTFVEAACSGTPVLYLPRGDWPEEAPLLRWQQAATYCNAITEKDLLKGNLRQDILFAKAQRTPARVKATGAQQIVQDVISKLN